MKIIKITKGKEVLVDDEDFEYLNQFKWYFNGRYALHTTGGRKNPKKIRMHVLINKTPSGYDTDHINGNGLDNRKENLRTATHAENMMNTDKWKTNTSGYKGVHWNKSKKKWIVKFNMNKKEKYIGSFDDINIAIAAYDNAILQYRGEFGRVNLCQI